MNDTLVIAEFALIWYVCTHLNITISTHPLILSKMLYDYSYI